MELLGAIDWDWTRPAALAIALAYGVFRCQTAQPKQSFISHEMRVAFFEGIGLLPMALLMITPLSDRLAKHLVEADGLILAASGFIACTAIIDRTRRAGPGLQAQEPSAP